MRHLFLLLPLLCALAKGPSTVVEGVVLGDGEPLQGAAIQLFENDRERYTTTTEEEGRFSFASVAPGFYRLVVTHLGYARYSTPLAVPLQDTLRMELTLSSRVIEKEEVVVIAHRAQSSLSPITFSNITARELALQPGMKDLPAHLATLPSITHYSESGNDLGYSYLRMRGFDQRRVAVAINGIPQNDPEEHNVFWINFFDLQGAIEDIQVQRGAGASSYGSTGIGGAINIVARPYKASPYATAEVGIGAYNTQRFTFEANTGILGGRYIAFGRFSRLVSDGYRDWSWSRFWRFFGGITRQGKQHTVTLQVYGGPQRDGLAYVGIPKDANEEEVTDAFGTVIDRKYNFSEATRDVEEFHQPHFELLHDWQLDPDWTFHQALFLVQGIGFFDFGGTFRSADYLRLPVNWRGLTEAERTLPLFSTAPDAQVLFRASLDQWQVGWMPRVTHVHKWGKTTLGGEARLHRSLRWGRIQEAEGLGVDTNDERVYSFRGEKIITSLFGSYLHRLGDLLAIQADLHLTWRRYRVYEEAFFDRAFSVPYLFVNPRLGVTIHPERPLSGYLSVALANREPRMKSLYDGEEAGAGFLPQFALLQGGDYDYGAPFVKPERLFDMEMGAQYTQPRYRASANVFWMEFRDEIVPSGGLDQFGVPRTGNAGKTRHIGLEAEFVARLASGLDLMANVTLTRNRFVEFTEFLTLADYSSGLADRAGNAIAGFPAQMANIGLTYQRAGFTARAHAMVTGRQYVDNGGGRDNDGIPRSYLEVDPYTLLHASFQYAFPLGLYLSVDVNNILNDEVLLFGNAGFGAPQFFPAATRHLLFTARYTIGK